MTLSGRCFCLITGASSGFGRILAQCIAKENNILQAELRDINMSGQIIGKCFCLITGASSGFGQSLAQLIVKESGLLANASEGSKIVLLARSISGMELTKKLMIENGNSMDRFTIELFPLDLSHPSETEAGIKTFIQNQRNEFENFLLFNNAGVLGDISGKFLDCNHSIHDYQTWFNINVTSPIFIINELCRHFHSSKRTLVQTSLLAAIKPCPSLSTYCAAKAGMDMFMRCLTLDHPDITTLSYSPGPMDTAMGKDLTENHNLESTRTFWKDLREKDEIVKPMDSAGKLLDILQKGDFKSGDFVDYFGRT